MTGTFEFDDSGVYQIKIKGVLSQKWSDWFDGFAITPLEDNQTLLVGQVSDQAALLGMLIKIRDLGLALISVEQLEDYC